MKQLFLTKGRVNALSVPKPQINKDRILVKVHYSFISTGTECATLSESKKSVLQKSLHNTKEKINKVVGAIKENGLTATLALIKSSLNKTIELGYSCSGEVIAVGRGIKNFAIGDLVACAGAGIAHHAEYVLVPKHLAVKISNKKYLKQVSLTTIGAIAMQGIRRADLSLGEKVCVIGLGLIGQITAQLAKLSGCTVFGIDIDDSKLFLAQKLGCDRVFNPSAENIENDILFETEHYGVDKTIITAASESGKIIERAMNITCRKGKVVLVGDVKIDFPRSPFYEKEIDFLISCSYGPGRYDQGYEQHGLDYPFHYVRWTENRNMKLFAQLVQSEKINVTPLISGEYHVDQAKSAYESLLQKKSLGIMLKYNGREKKDIILESVDTKTATAKSSQESSFSKIKLPETEAKKVNIALIGAGGFAKTKLLPIISKIKNINIDSIIDTNMANAISVSKLYNAKFHENDYKTVTTNPEIGAVVISTPHRLHTTQALACMSAGKAVFVEKPAAVTQAELEKLKTFFQENKNALYCVDFNRSFAPFIIKIKEVIQNRSTPLVVLYRMNSQFLDKDHWIQSEQHGGRVIGEACHIFELFNFLTESKPKSISVGSINTAREDLLKNDNFSVQISFYDGSICTLLYTALGSEIMGKERMELFFDGKSIVMDDYRKLEVFGLPKSLNKKTRYQDKGHESLLKEFMSAAQLNGPSPIPFERIEMATQMSFDVNAAIYGDRENPKPPAPGGWSQGNLYEE
jgi:predicted dehydrogenase/threonine dehydrogenase-like Zn-dependent dehydrogenase